MRHCYFPLSVEVAEFADSQLDGHLLGQLELEDAGLELHGDFDSPPVNLTMYVLAVVMKLGLVERLGDRGVQGYLLCDPGGSFSREPIDMKSKQSDSDAFEEYSGNCPW